MPRTPTATPNGKRAKELRDSLGLSVVEVAALAKRHDSTIRNMELGRTTSLTILNRVAIVLGVDVAELIQPDATAEQVA